MPRRSGGRSGGFSSPRRPAAPAAQQQRPAATHAPAPAQRQAPPPPAQHGGGGGGMLSGLGGMVAQGMAFGGGSAIAHRAIDSVLGSRNPPPEQAHAAAQQLAQAPEEPCSRQARTFADCMTDREGDLEACRYYFETLSACKQKGKEELAFQ